MRLKDAPMLTGAVVACGVVALAGRLNESPELTWIFQPLTIGLIAWAAWRRGMLANHYAQFVTLGLVCSLLADTLRLAPDQFPVSAGLLITACLSYLWAFTAEAPLRLLSWPIALTLALGLGFGVIVLPLLPTSHQMPAGVGIFVGAIMLGQAAVRIRSLPATSRTLAIRALGGAMLLLLSMGAVLINGYIQPIALAGLWEFVPYWAGQTLIALSVPERKRNASAVG